MITPKVRPPLRNTFQLAFLQIQVDFAQRGEIGLTSIAVKKTKPTA